MRAAFYCIYFDVGGVFGSVAVGYAASRHAVARNLHF